MEANGSSGENAKLHRRRLVQATAAKLRDIVMAQEPDTQIGSLNEVAKRLEVGVVTVQQAARILEHEGLLEVRRGPGGGYYGKRPDEAALERAVAAFMRVHTAAHMEVTEMTSLLDCELTPVAARCTDEALREKLRQLSLRIDAGDTPDERIRIEKELHELLFAMADRPLLALLARVSARLRDHANAPLLFPGEEGVAAWKSARRALLKAVLEHDEELARFEAHRYRRNLLDRLQQTWLPEKPSL